VRLPGHEGQAPEGGLQAAVRIDWAAALLALAGIAFLAAIRLRPSVRRRPPGKPLPRVPEVALAQITAPAAGAGQPTPSSPTPAPPSFEQIAQDLPQILFVADDDSALVYCNPQWWDYTGQAAGAVPDLYAAVHPEDAAALRRSWQGARAGHALLRLLLRLRAASGQYRRFQM
jgi:PAS domain-containing protein